MVLEECSNIYWDVIVLVETWRESVKEEFLLDGGHTWYGSGGCKGRCGVGFIVHNRHDGQHLFAAVSERLATLWLTLAGLKVKLFGVYMPDSTYCDAEVETVYNQLDFHLRDCTCKRHRHCIVAGDFNARVGSQDFYDDISILGSGGLPDRNSRGDWFLQWCTINQLVIGNTHFESDAEHIWTYRNGDRRKQLDYMLFDKQLFKNLEDCGVQPELDTGSDHRAVQASLSYTTNKQNRKKRRCQKKVQSIPNSTNEILTANLQDMTATMGLLRSRSCGFRKQCWKPHKLRKQMCQRLGQLKTHIVKQYVI